MFFKHTFLTFLAQVLTLVLGFAGSVVIARVLGPQGRGEFALVNTMARLVALMSNVGIGAAAIYYLNRDTTARSLIASSALLLQLALTLIATLITLGMLPWLSTTVYQHEIAQSLLLLGLGLIPLIALSNATSNILVGLHQIQEFNYSRIITAAAQLLFVVLLVLLLGMGVVGALVATSIALALGIVYVFACLRPILPKLTLRISRAWSTTLTAYGIKTWVGNVLQYFNYRLDFFIVNLFVGASGVGQYSIAVTLAEFLWYIPTAVATILFPRTAADRQQAATFTPFVARTTLLFTTVIACALGGLARPIISFVFGPDFHDAVPALLILLPGVVFLGTGKVLASDLAGQGKPQYGTWAAVLALIVTITFDFLLIPRLGIAGAALASTLSYILSFLVLLVLYIRLSRNTIHAVLVVHNGDWPVYRRTMQRCIAGMKGYLPPAFSKKGGNDPRS